MKPLPDAPNLPQSQPLTWPVMAWLTVGLTGVLAPAAAMVFLLGDGSAASLAWFGGPIFAVGLMGAGMIGAAAAGRFLIGIGIGLSAGLGLLLLALGLGMPTLPHPMSLGLAFVLASISFAARGALFACSAAGRGWWIAVFVVGGEAAIILTAIARPGELPDWLLVLLPAQWANVAIQTALTGTGALAASSALVALGGTALATLLVVRLWPRRWTYLIMFSVWLGLSALVWYRPAPPLPSPDVASLAIPGAQDNTLSPDPN